MNDSGIETVTILMPYVLMLQTKPLKLEKVINSSVTSVYRRGTSDLPAVVTASTSAFAYPGMQLAQKFFLTIQTELRQTELIQTSKVPTLQYLNKANPAPY